MAGCCRDLDTWQNLPPGDDVGVGGAGAADPGEQGYCEGSHHAGVEHGQTQLRIVAKDFGVSEAELKRHI